MTPEYISTLVDYHYWARDRMLDAVGALSVEQYERDLRCSFASVRETANHVFHAEWIWYARWMGQSPAASDRPKVTDVVGLRDAWAVHEMRVRAFVVEQCTVDVNQVFEYRTLAGVEMRSKFWEMFVHVVNHATYHRGQIAAMIRQLGAPPHASTDMIVYFRERG